jgi:hypothetical protein
LRAEVYRASAGIKSFPTLHRSSIRDGDRLVVAPSQVRTGDAAFATERIDADIDTRISNEEDGVTHDETRVLTQNIRPLLVVHVANAAMRLMSARYPEDLVRGPLPPDKTCRTRRRFR